MSLRAAGFIPLPGGEGAGFDHADTFLDPRGGRLYVAHTATNAVDVIDCRTNAYLRSVPELLGVAGVLIDTEHDLLFTSDRAGARVSIFRCSDETLRARVASILVRTASRTTRPAGACTASTWATRPAQAARHR